MVSRARVRQPPRPAARDAGAGYHLSKDLADKTIEFIRDSKVIAPDKPWFTYLCPGAGHAPHHVFAEWADRYAGVFDMGYERYREIVLENQKRLGIVPPDTELSPVNPYSDVSGPNGEPWPPQDTVRPWDSLGDDEKRLFSRMAEVFAGFLSYTDAQIGRMLDYLEESGQLDNTIIVVISDNGASGEGGPNGSVNEVKFFNGYIDSVEESLKHFDDLGGPQTYNHYPIGWAMASTPRTSCSSATPRMRAASPTPRSSPGPTGSVPTGRCATTTSTSPTSRPRCTTCWTSPRPRPCAECRRSRWTA